VVPHDTRKLHFEIEELEDVDPTSARVFRAFMTALRLHKQQMMRSLGAHGMHPGQALSLIHI